MLRNKFQTSRLMHQIVSANVNSSRRWWVLATVVAAQFMFGVDAFIVNVAFPTDRSGILHDRSGEPGAAGAIDVVGVVRVVDRQLDRISVMDAARITSGHLKLMVTILIVTILKN